jgi:hypothetical protein
MVKPPNCSAVDRTATKSADEMRPLQQAMQKAVPACAGFRGVVARSASRSIVRRVIEVRQPLSRT